MNNVTNGTPAAMDSGEAPVLWRHSNPEQTNYEALRQWSIDHLGHFWEEVWHWTGVKSSVPFDKPIEDEKRMSPRPAFFPGARLNFAENLLYPSSNPREDDIAIIAANEQSREHITWARLRQRVRECVKAMKKHGLVANDRIAGYVANHADTVVIMLAATSLGAIWTGVSPDTGVTAVLERLQQIRPKLLFADNAVLYNGKTHDGRSKVQEIVKALDGLEAAIILESVKGTSAEVDTPSASTVKVLSYSQFIQTGSSVPTESPEFLQLPADHPVYILYSSGTTGKPKCIVHGAIGTLIQHKKEHALQCDIRAGDRLQYFSTTSWMMWHWQISALASGATLVLYDGSPFRPLDNPSDPTSGNMAMPRLIDELGITHFGTSAKFLSVLEQANLVPREHTKPAAMSRLRAIYSTGSPLAPSTFDYTYRAFGPDLNLGSITGGTDIISLFGAPSLLSPVYRGEVQVRGLGMAVEVWDSATGENITKSGEAGELVCSRPFPCQPVCFWGDEDGSKYGSSYFERFTDASGRAVWHHGDFITISPRTGGMAMLGRSDGVLKPSGVRFGSAEIYNVLLKDFADEVEDALCVGQRREKDVDERVVLFLKMAEGHTFDAALGKRIQQRVASELSRRHAPAIVDATPAIPVTTNGKKVEVAVKNILCGVKVRTGASVANAECLEWYREWTRQHED